MASPLRANLKKELKDTEREMENAFKFQSKSDPESKAAQFFVEKIEILGQKKAALRKELDTMESSASNVISLEEARQDLKTEWGQFNVAGSNYLPFKRSAPCAA